MSGPADRPSRRRTGVLFAVCRDYLATGAAVSARRLTGQGFRWSEATLRSDLAELERAGYLWQRHTSGGRLPTARGLQDYVDHLDATAGPEPRLARAVDRALGPEHADPGERRRAAAIVLSEATGCAALAVQAEERDARVRALELVEWMEHRALALLELDDGQRVVRPIAAERTEAGAPFSLEARLRWLLVGRTFPEARRRIAELLIEAAVLDRSVVEALRVGLEVCEGAGARNSQVERAGQPGLAARLAGAQGSAEALGAVLALLEDDDRLAAVLRSLLPHEESGARVYVTGSPRASAAPGLGPLAGLPGLSLVGCRVGPSRARSAEAKGQAAVGGSDGLAPRPGPWQAVALVGPDRMDFSTVIRLVEYAARALAPLPAG